MRDKLLLFSLLLICTVACVLSLTDHSSTSITDTIKCSGATIGCRSSDLELTQDDIASSGRQTVLQFPYIDVDQSTPTTSTVPLPHDNPTKSFWLDTPGANPLADEGSAGELTPDADVCIIGSGITGVSTAWHLSKMLGEETRDEADRPQRRNVVILEARRFCSGATGRNGGHLTRMIFNAFHTLQSQYDTSEALKSFDIEAHTANSIVKFITDRGLESAVDLVQGGHVSVFRTEGEERNARRDWEGVRHARREAGGGTESGDEDVEGVEWINSEEMHKRFGLDPKLNYSGARFIGHNLWPCKFVTQLYKDIQHVSPSDNVNVSLHTKTPVTSITRIDPHLQGDEPSSPTDNNRRWQLHTPRGDVACNYVVHATNGYAAHLLPFISGSSIPNSEFDARSFGFESTHPSTSNIGVKVNGEFSSVPKPHARPRGAYGLKPTRGQVGAVRAAVNASTFGWLESWDDGPEGWNYWFPRYQDTHSGTGTEPKHPLIILGGERRSSGGTLEVGNADDSTVNVGVSRMLRAFLPGFYEGRFGREEGQGDGWEMEWTGVMGYTKTGDPFVGPVHNPLKDHNSDIDSNETATAGRYEGQYIAAGYSGHGMPRAYGCAEAVAGMIAAEIKGKVWTRPTWLPERYLTWATEP